MGTLKFWTDGPSFTGLLTELFTSGEFYKFETIMKDGGMDKDRIKEAFRFKFEMTGSTRNGGELTYVVKDNSPDDFAEMLYTSILTCVKSIDRDLNVLDLGSSRLRENKDIKTLLSYFGIQEIKKLCFKNIIEGSGFEITTLYDAITRSETSISGLLLSTGVFVQCGYQQHMELHPLLVSLDLIEGFERLDSDAISISSNMLTGGIAFTLQSGSYDYSRRGFTLSDSQLKELWKLKDYNLAHYSSHGRTDSVNKELLQFYSHKKGIGSKYGNLEFLKEFYPEVPLANYADAPNLAWTETIVRTSPKKSMPGLLSSIKASTKEEVAKAVNKIKEDYTIYENVQRNNEIHWFFQEFIEGQNGVVNCTEKQEDQYPSKMSPEYINTLKYDIDIACSTNQGDIVEGHVSNIEVGFNNARYLRRLSRQLANDFKADIQLEFVILPDDSIRIVQLRLFDNMPNKRFDVSSDILMKAAVKGRTFSSPEYYTNVEVTFDDILIVEQDCSSDKLIGKKALIVENDTNFSHVLALSKALNIPSIYATGKVSLKRGVTYKFNTEHTSGFINIIN